MPSSPFQIRWLAGALLPLIAIIGSGCTGADKRINPDTEEIDIAVWVVLADSDVGQGTLWDAVGQPTNRGCRLSETDIREHVAQLQAKAAGLYGGRTRFKWTGDIEVLADSDIPSAPLSRTQNWSLWTSPIFQPWQSGFSFPNKINVYFVGNVQPGPGVFDVFAFTWGPDRAANSPGVPAFVLINDGGMDLPSGFAPVIAGRGPHDFSPAKIRLRHVVEHEITHYLARFGGGTFPAITGQSALCRTYSASEHVPAGCDNILSLDDVNVPKIPGVVKDPLTEIGQIYSRVRAGLWNQP